MPKTIPVIVVTNQKGGVGKTTTAAAIADRIRNSREDSPVRILCIDMDSQGNFTSLEKKYLVKSSPSTVGFLEGLPVATTTEGQAVTIGDADLLSYGLTEMPDSQILSEKIRAISDYFDCVVIDTHPGADLPTILAMTAATHIVIPVTPDKFGVESLKQSIERISDAQEFNRNGLEDHIAVVITKYRSIVKTHIQCAQEIKDICDEYGLKVVGKPVRLNSEIERAQVEETSIYEIGNYFKGAVLDYVLAVNDIMDWLNEDYED